MQIDLETRVVFVACGSRARRLSLDFKQRRLDAPAVYVPFVVSQTSLAAPRESQSFLSINFHPEKGVQKECD